MKRKTVLATSRLRVTRWLEEDLDDLHRLHSDPEVMRFLRGGLPETRAQASERLALYLREQVDPGWTKWRVETTDGVMIGRGGFGGFGPGHEPDNQGAGSGTRLIRAFETWASSLGARRLLVNSGWQRHAAHQFYERRGYRSTGARFTKKLPEG